MTVSKFSVDYSALLARNLQSSSKICVQIPPKFLHATDRIVDEVESIVPGSTVVVLADSSLPDCCVDLISAAHDEFDVLLKVGSICESYVNCDDRVILAPICFDLSLDMRTAIRDAVLKEQGSNEFCWIMVISSIPGIYAQINDDLNGMPNLHCTRPEAIDSGDDFPFIHSGDLGLVIVLDQQVGREISLKFKNAIVLFANFETCEIITCRSLRERTKRYGILNRVPRPTAAFGLVVHSTSKAQAALAFSFCKLIRSRGHPAYVFSVGKMTPQKLGNFPDIDVFVVFGCSRPIFSDDVDFFMTMLTPFEALCYLEMYVDLNMVILIIDSCDIWGSLYATDAVILEQLVAESKDELTKVDDQDKCTAMTVNTDYSVSKFSQRSYKGVPGAVVAHDGSSNDDGDDNSDGNSAGILTGIVGLAREYNHEM